MQAVNKRKDGAKRLAGIGIFAALAIVVSFATSFIKIGYLSLDAGDIVIVLAAYIYGPVTGIAISLISSLVSFLYSGTLWWGMLMDFASSATFSFVASFVYSRRKCFKFAIIGIYAAVISVTAVMMPLNILVTPLYMPVSTEFVIKEIPRLLLPFNFAKALFNGGAVLLLYKPIVRALRRAKLVPLPARPTPVSNNAAVLGEKKGSNTTLALTLGALSVALAAGALIFLSTL